jgi:hypothetical protein
MRSPHGASRHARGDRARIRGRRQAPDTGNAKGRAMTDVHDAPEMPQASAQSMVRVWDPLVRVFHWGLVAAFATAWLTADEVQPVHELAGHTVAGLLAFRLVWGFVGGRCARFAQFLRGPGATLRYLGDLGRGRRRGATTRAPILCSRTVIGSVSRMPASCSRAKTLARRDRGTGYCDASHPIRAFRHGETADPEACRRRAREAMSPRPGRRRLAIWFAPPGARRECRADAPGGRPSPRSLTCPNRHRICIAAGAASAPTGERECRARCPRLSPAPTSFTSSSRGPFIIQPAPAPPDGAQARQDTS